MTRLAPLSFRLSLLALLAVLALALQPARAVATPAPQARPAAALAAAQSPAKALTAHCHDSAPAADGSAERRTGSLGGDIAAPRSAGHNCCDQDGMAPCPPGHGCGCAGLASLAPPLAAVVALALPRTDTATRPADTPPPQRPAPPLRPPIA